MGKNIFSVIGMSTLLMLQVACRENEFGTVDLTMPESDPEEEYVPVNAQYTYNHPCAMYNQADFERVKTMLDDGTAPEAVKLEFENLKTSGRVYLPYTPNPTVEIVRGNASGTLEGAENYRQAMQDAASAYQMALLWKLTDDERYASNAVNILNEWARVCQRVTAADKNYFLAAGAQGYTFANAAEILRDYDGWSETDFNTFKTWMVNVFASLNEEFLVNHTAPDDCPLHCWSNWDLVNMASYLSIGILTENDEMINFLVNYFYTGDGNGCIKNLITGHHTDPLGTEEEIFQNQESGRDQGHSLMSAVVTANLCQIAYTLYKDNRNVPELNFFDADGNAIIKMGEYVALTNLRDGNDRNNSSGNWLLEATSIPFTTYEYCVDCSCNNKSHSEIQTAFDDEGRGQVRPGWEIYRSYVVENGLENISRYVTQFADKLRPEGGAGESENRYGNNSGAYDQLGWSTLMLYRE